MRFLPITNSTEERIEGGVNMDNNFPFYGKVVVRARIECVTGLHIGASREVVEIGGVDNPVMRDPRTGIPYIPGSSVKGKMRSIAERVFKKELNRSTGNGFRHECTERTCEVCRVFGSTKGREDNGGNIPSRIRIRDSFMAEDCLEWLSEIDSPTNYTELKYENALDRITCAANPRPVERVPAGAEFEFEMVYDLEDEQHTDEDLQNILTLLKMVEDDYIGGHGSRGHGKIRFKDVKLSLRSLAYYFGNQDEIFLAEGDLDDVKNALQDGKLSEIKAVFQG